MQFELKKIVCEVCYNKNANQQELNWFNSRWKSGYVKCPCEIIKLFFYTQKTNEIPSKCPYITEHIVQQNITKKIDE